MKTSLKRLTHAAGLVSVAISMRASVIDATFVDEGNYSYAVDYMTDLDQRRAFLPNNGAAYCVPTSALNLLAYAANFGFPELAPGPGLWEGVPGHGKMTLDLGDMGERMSTDPEAGTTLTGQTAGLTGWLNDYGFGSFSVVTFARDDDFWPTIDIGACMATAGAAVNFAYGRYEFVPGFQGVPWLTDRVSGHSVTLQRAVASNGSLYGPREIRMHNPSAPNDNDPFSNSPFQAESLPTAVNMDVAYDAHDDGDGDYFRATSLVNPPPPDGRLRLIDSVTGLYPPGGLSYNEIEVSAEFAGGGLGFVTESPTGEYQAQTGARFVAAIPHPELHSALVAIRKDGVDTLYQLPHRGERGRALLKLPIGTRHLVLGRGQEVYALTPRTLVQLRVGGASARPVRTATLPSVVASLPIEAATYREATGELLLLSGTGQRLFVLDAPSLALVATLSVRSPFGAVAVRSVAVQPGPQRSLLVAFADGKVARLDYGASLAGATAQTPSLCQLSFRQLPGVSDARWVDFDGAGRLYTVDARAGLVELIPNSTGGWSVAPQPYYRAADFIGRKFTPFRSRTNLRPEIHDQPGWRHDIDEGF